jgi:hypothetical protein
VNLKIQFAAQPLQQLHIAAAPVAENKIRADADAVNLPQVARQFADENFAGLFTERRVKMNFQQRVRAQRLNGPDFLGTRKNLRRHAVRRDHGIGMTVKSDHQGGGVVLPRIGDHLPDDLLVAEMHAVENTDGQAGLAAAQFQLARDGDDFHGRRIVETQRSFAARSFCNPAMQCFHDAPVFTPPPASKTAARASPTAPGTTAKSRRAAARWPRQIFRKRSGAGRQVRAAAQLLAQVVREAADVGALGAGHAEFPQRLGIARQNGNCIMWISRGSRSTSMPWRASLYNGTPFFLMAETIGGICI